MRTPLAIALMSLALLVPAVARADDAPNVADLKRRGATAMDSVDFVTAARLYREAIALAPGDASLYYNLGRALDALGQHPEALEALETFAARATPEVRAKVPKLDELLAAIRGRVGEIRLKCSADVPTARVRIGSRELTGCTQTARSVKVSVEPPSASVVVELSSSTHRAPPTTIVVSAGSAVNVTLPVEPLVTTGTLRVVAVPDRATVSVDGTERGASPIELALGAGNHDLALSAAGYQASRTSVVLAAGEQRDVRITLEKTPPLTSRWWFWAGAGAAVAIVGTVVVYLLVQPEEDPPRGSIEPGQLRSGAVRF